MTSQTLYSVRTHVGLDGDSYFITKFVDGEVESTYNTTIATCDCPAGHRHTCRHRQMLPQMLAHGLANTHWFWDYDRGYACDFQGGSKQLADALTLGLPAEEETKVRAHSTEVSASDFDSEDTGSNPVVPANTPASHRNGWRRF